MNNTSPILACKDVSIRYMAGDFKEIGIKEYITEVRMKNAKRFLSEGASVSKCAAMVGYDDEFNFSRAFKRQVGLSPSEWKKQHNEKQRLT